MVRGWGFITGLVVGFGLAGGLFFGSVFGLAGTPTAASGGPSAILTLKRARAAEPAKPKCLFVGGSSVDLGISARRAEELTAVPCRNFGLWVPLGLAFMLDQARIVLRPGDTVVLPVEFELYDWPGRSRLWADPQFLPVLFSAETAYLRRLPVPEQLQLALRLPLTWPLEAALRPTGGRRSGLGQGPPPKNFNAWGDRTDNERRPRATLPPKVCEPSPRLVEGFGTPPKGFPALTDFIAWARSNAVTVVATFPNLSRHGAHDSPKALDARQKVLAFYDRHGVPFLETFEGTAFPPEDCYDTMYHLFDDAVVRRTDRLVEYLRPYLPASSKAAGARMGSQ